MFVKPLVPLSLQVNGRPVALAVPPSTLLVDLLREQLALLERVCAASPLPVNFIYS